MDPTDAELVARCLEAKDAFEQLYRRHAPAVFAFLRSMHRGDEHAAADSLQETFLRAFDALGRFDRARPLRPWLFTIAANVARDALERTARLDLLPGQTAPGPTKESEDPAQRALVADAAAALLRVASGRLPARALASFLLARAHGFSQDEVAEIQGCSLATVKRDVADAFATLAGVAVELGLA